jgi:SAM-dependent methyltransferase
MGRLGSAWRKVRWSLAQRGILGTLRVFVERAGSSEESSEAVAHPFDVRYGVDTGGLVGGGSLTVGHRHDAFITAYAGIPPSRFEGAMARWRETVVSPEVYTFVDLGCGKGRAVMLASGMGFHEVMGVELNPGLAEVAGANLAVWKAGRSVRIVCGDATEVELPAGPCVVYLFNPFGAPVLRRLLERLEARGGAVDVVYQNPEQEAVFAEFPRFALLWSEVFAMSEEDAAADLVSSPVDRCNAYRLG